MVRNGFAVRSVGLVLLTAMGLGGLAAVARGQEETSSQSNDDQLNQLLLFETTPNKSAAGEGYITAGVRYLNFGSDINDADTYQLSVQGQYSFSDQIAVGAVIPFFDDIETKSGNGLPSNSASGFGDVAFYGQYKLDQFVSHDVVDLTAQLDLVLPSGSLHNHLGNGHVGLRPEILAYKNFAVGPGELGVYGQLGVTLTTNSNFIMGLAGTYNWNRIIAVLEFDDEAGSKQALGGKPQVTISPGLGYTGYGPWELLVGLPFGLDSSSPNWGVVVKLTYAFSK